MAYGRLYDRPAPLASAQKQSAQEKIAAKRDWSKIAVGDKPSTTRFLRLLPGGYFADWPTGLAL